MTIATVTPSVRPSISDGSSDKSEIRVYDHHTLMGTRSPVPIKWVGPFKAVLDKLDIEVTRAGRPSRCEIQANGMFWEGTFYTDLPWANEGDCLRLDCDNLPVEGM